MRNRTCGLAADGGHGLACRQTATNAYGSATAESTPVQVQGTSSPPAGTVVVLSKLRVRKGKVTFTLSAPARVRFTLCRFKGKTTVCKRVKKRAVSSKVAGQVRDMMVGVVQGGTGTAASIPGVVVAGKTGTAELVPTADAAPDPKNTTAWFVAFAPAYKPRVAVAVMMVGAGAGGKAAAPIAKKVLQAAL